MGDIADGIIDGTFCQESGEYIGEPCGHPRTAKFITEGVKYPTKKKKQYNSTKKMCECGRLPIHFGQRKKNCHLCRKDAYELLQEKKVAN